MFKPLSYQKTDINQTKVLREKIKIMTLTLLPGHTKWFNFKIYRIFIINVHAEDFRT